MFRITVAVTAIALLLMVSPAIGQLSNQDIEALRQRGEAEGWTFTVGPNPATERSIEERCGLVLPDDWQSQATFKTIPDKIQIPSTFDWRWYNGCTPVKDQASCGSCWAFATVGCLESAIKIKDGIDVDLSEQWLVSCNTNGWSCDGGWMAHAYHESRVDLCGGTGAVLEASFPYVARDAACGCPYAHPYRINSWAFIGSNDMTSPPVEDIKRAIMLYGPVSVYVYAGDAFSAYTTGVFNACETGTTNHVVVLVGWDDNQGTEGVWFLRNSWSPDWGEGGYMRIEYGCNKVEQGAAYIDYAIPHVFITADTTVGPVPLGVQFDATSIFPVESWTWSFGDGDSAYVQNPIHTYDQPGYYTVTAAIVSDSETYSQTKVGFIAVTADTLKAGDSSGAPGATVRVTVSGNNTIPVQYIKIPVEFPGDLSLVFDSFSTAGCRTEYFEEREFISYDMTNRRFALHLETSTSGTSPDLAAGEGDLVNLYFTIGSTAVTDQTAAILLDGYLSYLPMYYGATVSYGLSSLPGSIAVGDCVYYGDLNNDGSIDIADLVYLVSYAFSGGPAPIPFEAGNVDCLGSIDIADLVYLVSYMFAGGPPSPCGC